MIFRFDQFRRDTGFRFVVDGELGIFCQQGRDLDTL